MTTFGLRQAAQEAGTSKSTILRAIQSGRLSATRTDDGGYSIEPAELFRVYPPKSVASDHEADRSAGQNAIALAPGQFHGNARPARSIGSRGQRLAGHP